MNAIKKIVEWRRNFNIIRAFNYNLKVESKKTQLLGNSTHILKEYKLRIQSLLNLIDTIITEYGEETIIKFVAFEPNKIIIKTPEKDIEIIGKSYKT